MNCVNLTTDFNHKNDTEVWRRTEIRKFLVEAMGIESAKVSVFCMEYDFFFYRTEIRKFVVETMGIESAKISVFCMEFFFYSSTIDF